MNASPDRTLLRRLLIVRSAAMRRAFETLEKVTGRDTTLLILGETGSGKDHLAASLHRCGPRNGQPFVTVDCTTLTADLFESELFGHEKGAFTGASSRRIGRLEQARGGTVYLDQVSTLSSPLQAKLLRVIQDKVITRVGGTHSIPLDFRLITSAASSLEGLMASGTLRTDLYYRLNVVTVEVPPLRERRSDLPYLVRRFIRQFTEGAERRPVASARTMEALQEFPWPGNIRQLRNVIERAVILTPAGEIEPEGLVLDAEIRPADLMARAATELWSLEELERRYIAEIFRRTRENESKAAALLGMNRKTLLEKRKKYGIGRRSQARRKRAAPPGSDSKNI
jgi:DNA-binding NtrC family response regulator